MINRKDKRSSFLLLKSAIYFTNDYLAVLSWFAGAASLPEIPVPSPTRWMRGTPFQITRGYETLIG
jgi:hypothetical protein